MGYEDVGAGWDTGYPVGIFSCVLETGSKLVLLVIKT